MIHRLGRFAVAAFCLASLLAEVGLSWLWWECRLGRGYVAEGAVGGTYVMLISEPSDVRVGAAVLRRWPGRGFFRARRYHEGSDGSIIWRPVHMRRWEWMHLFGQTGDGNLLVAPDIGEPLREQWYHALAGVDSPARSWSLLGVPHVGLVAAAGAPPLLFAGVGLRRLRERRRRVRLGLCLACGYDLRHSPAKCPECGAAARSSQRGAGQDVQV